MPELPPLPQSELFIIGLGPGGPGLLAPDARAALEASDLIAGYSGYVDLVDPAFLRGKTVIATGMRVTHTARISASPWQCWLPLIRTRRTCFPSFLWATA